MINTDNGDGSKLNEYIKFFKDEAFTTRQLRVSKWRFYFV